MNHGFAGQRHSGRRIRRQCPNGPASTLRRHLSHDLSVTVILNIAIPADIKDPVTRIVGDLERRSHSLDQQATLCQMLKQFDAGLEESDPLL